MSIVNFSDVITFSRASGGGRFNAQGQYEWVSAGQPRFDFDPVTLQPRGILIEEQRTNLLTYSERLWDTAVWGVGTTLGNFFTVTSSTDIADIYGAPAPIAKFVAGTAPSPLFLRKNGLSLAGGSTYSPSLFVYVPAQAGVTSWAVYADYQDSDASLPFESSAFGKWIRVVIPAKTLTGARNFIDFNLRVNGLNPSSGFTFYSTGTQLEVGNAPTSYIPTTTSQVTRAADVARVNNLSPWFNAEEGTWKVRAQGIVGRPLLTAGGSIITADSVGVKDYTLTYNSDPGAEFMQIGQGHIQKIEYYPKGNVGGGNA